MLFMGKQRRPYISQEVEDDDMVSRGDRCPPPKEGTLNKLFSERQEDKQNRGNGYVTQEDKERQTDMVSS